MTIVGITTTNGKHSEIEWPKEWRLPAIGERIYRPDLGMLYVDAVLWDFSRSPGVELVVSSAVGWQ